MAWSKEEFARMREERARWLSEIASIEAGHPPAASRLVQGQPVGDLDEHLAHLKRNVVANEEILTINGEPLDA